MVTVVVDSREPVVMRPLLEELGAHVHVKLSWGDYLVGERAKLRQGRFRSLALPARAPSPGNARTAPSERTHSRRHSAWPSR